MAELVPLVHDRYGDRGPVVVLVHGLGSMAAWWPPGVVERLSTDHRVVVPDLRDSGRSPSMDHLGTADDTLAAWSTGERTTPPYTLHDMAADLVGLLDRLHVDLAHVVGASMGGMVAQHTAFGFPDRVASLTSIMSTTGGPSIPSGDPAVLASLRESTPTDDEETFVAASVESARRTSHAALFDRAEAERRYRAYWRIGTNPAGSARQLVAVLDDGDRTERLARLEVPTLVVHGDADPMIRVEAGRATAAAVDGARYLELDRVGHALPGAVQPHLVRAIAAHVGDAERVPAARRAGTH